jgi:hypothetical protein
MSESRGYLAPSMISGPTLSPVSLFHCMHQKHVSYGRLWTLCPASASMWHREGLGGHGVPSVDLYIRVCLSDVTFTCDPLQRGNEALRQQRQ